MCIVLLNACSSLEKQNKPVFLDQHSQFYLQPVPKELWGHSSLQKLLITTPQDNHELLLQTELLPNQINMVGLSPAGLVLFKLTWSQEAGIQTNTNIMAKGIDAKVMLAYYQLANWPIAVIRLGLQDLLIKLSPEDQQTRDFWRGHELVFSVEHKAKHNLMTHYINHYQIKIETISQNIIEF